MYASHTLAKKLIAKHGTSLAHEKATARWIAASSIIESMMIRYGGAALVDGSLDEDDADYMEISLAVNNDDELREVVAAWSLMAYWAKVTHYIETKMKKGKKNNGN